MPKSLVKSLLRTEKQRALSHKRPISHQPRSHANHAAHAHRLDEASFRPEAAFRAELEAVQPRLLAYIVAISANPATAPDILQEVNVRAIEKHEDRDHTIDVFTWATQLVDAYLMKRPRKVDSKQYLLDQDVIERLSRLAKEDAWETHDRERKALEGCLAQLPAEKRAMVDLRYRQGVGVGQIASALGLKENTVSKTLERLRASLRKCIEDQLNAGER